jgi:hypothetical protein
MESSVVRRLSGSGSIACTVLCLFFLGCNQAPRLPSGWSGEDKIHVDGSDADWNDRRFLLEEVPLTVSVVNDSNFLYLCAVTTDRQLQMRILRGGIELWIDPTGGASRFFGVRVPRANPEGIELPGGAGFGGNSKAPSDDHLARFFSELVGPRELFLLDSPRGSSVRTVFSGDNPVQAQLRYRRGRLVYEARVPLQYSDSPSYELKPGKKPVGLALRVPAPRMERPGDEAQFGRGADGRGGIASTALGDAGDRTGAAGRGTRRDRRRAGRLNPSAGPLEQWVRVDLSSGS